MSKLWLVFPTTLFDLDVIKEDITDFTQYKYLIIEEPLYFGSSQRVENMNKLKLVLHRASMKYYQNLLETNGIDVNYYDYNELIKNEQDYTGILSHENVNSISEINVWDPVDRLVQSKLEQTVKVLGTATKLIIHETPNFLLDREDLEEYYQSMGGEQSKKGGYFHADFYNWSKEKLDILVGEKSYDTENRSSFPSDLKIPQVPSNSGDNKWIDPAKKYVQQNFVNNYGEVDNFIFTVTHQSSKNWFDKFVEERFKNFGTFQDAMSAEEDFGFHSLIAPMLNVGLLDPAWVLIRAEQAFKSKKIPINSYEGFVRQIIGWREYSRMLYLYLYDEMKTGNHFNNQRRLTSKWYTGQLGVLPVDDTIMAAFDNGYLHHILRLMMMSNFMNLVGVYPDDVYRWFMEFSCDSYDWVMINNVYSMGLWADGGLTMRKPYISSSNYILKMSDFPKDGKWENIWKDLFYYWLQKNRDKLKGTPYLRNLFHFDNKTDGEQKDLINRAEKFINSVTQ